MMTANWMRIWVKSRPCKGFQRTTNRDYGLRTSDYGLRTYQPPAPTTSRGRQEVEAQRQNRIDRQQLHTLHPVRLAIVRDERDRDDRQRDRHQLERREQ